MRIIRFRDEDGRVHLGCDERDGEATLLEGELLSETLPTRSQQRIKVAEHLPPLDPRVILCIGLNYRRHAEETGAKIPTEPMLFLKNPAAAIGAKQPIVLPKVCMDPPQVDYECELAVVIGRAARDVSEADALDYVLGYTIANDISARNWQRNRSGGQFCRGKGFDTFCPLGPALVTADEIPDPQSLKLTTRLNGQVMQQSSTSDMIFTVAQLIASLSISTTLLPGTVLLTGTPSGVGAARKPPVFLADGDVLELSIDHLGTLINPVVAG